MVVHAVAEVEEQTALGRDRHAGIEEAEGVELGDVEVAEGTTGAAPAVVVDRLVGGAGRDLLRAVCPWWLMSPAIARPSRA